MLTCCAPVVVGLPVFNGQRYLAEAVDSILSQTHKDFVLIISDNASTDATGGLCKEFARRDPRVRYVRQPSNIGAAANFNLVVGLADCRYFKWFAHDDVIEPTYLERCVEVLENDRGAVLCQSLVKILDNDDICETYNHAAFGTDNPDQITRFAARLRARRCMDVFGLIRFDVLCQTPLIAPFVGSDRTLLLDLAMRGRFALVPEYLLINRDHPNRLTRSLQSSDQLQWYAPEKAGQPSLRTWDLYKHALQLLFRHTKRWSDRVRGLATVMRSLGYYRRWLKLPLELLNLAWPRAMVLEDRVVDFVRGSRQDKASSMLSQIKLLTANALLGICPDHYQVVFAGKNVRFLTDRPYLKRWYFRNRLRGTLHGYHEPAVTILLERLVSSKHALLDIGSHLGYFSILFASVPGNGAMAIELDPTNFRALTRSISWQPETIKSHVRAINVGISDKASTIYIPESRPHDASSSINSTQTERSNTIPVKLSTIDTVLEEMTFAPDIVKIDVEGFEVHALRGATKLLSEQRPVLLIELHPSRLRSLGKQVSDVLEQTKTAGYRNFRFLEYRRHRGSKLTEKVSSSSQNNCGIVCIHEDDESGLATVEALLC